MLGWPHITFQQSLAIIVYTKKGKVKKVPYYHYKKVEVATPTSLALKD
jgi:hypothetical protein